MPVASRFAAMNRIVKGVGIWLIVLIRLSITVEIRKYGSVTTKEAETGTVIILPIGFVMKNVEMEAIGSNVAELMPRVIPATRNARRILRLRLLLPLPLSRSLLL